ncbi:MAG: AbrB/MazE/SpoVT family DNA-binding domain-containing protein [Methanosphaera stadtmanae]|nr:AbrB/MazE/SpoVT family DNA-binding domain-containing protein [Methanosphaera stadtmanae]
MVKVGIYKGFRITIPASIRKQLNISQEDTLDMRVKNNKIIIKVEKQESLDNLTDLFELEEETNSLTLKKESW